MTKEELKRVLDKHKLWLAEDPAGVRANLSWANLSGADLSGADLSWADLIGTNLSRANLSRADLSRANLSRADLSGANLSRADLGWADLSRANLSGVDLSGADLRGANLYNTGLLIFIFQQDQAIYMPCGMLRIGCEYHRIEHWAKNYRAIGKVAGYSKEEIKAYANFIRLCKGMKK